jgi:hypothetical protein
MTIRDIIVRGKGIAGAWRVERDGSMATLVHYSTPMLRWDTERPAQSMAVLSIGYGSVSDQNGCNTAFRALDCWLRYDRDRKGGGPRVSDISDLRGAA